MHLPQSPKMGSQNSFDHHSHMDCGAELWLCTLLQRVAPESLDNCAWVVGNRTRGAGSPQKVLELHLGRNTTLECQTLSAPLVCVSKGPPGVPVRNLGYTNLGMLLAEYPKKESTHAMRAPCSRRAHRPALPRGPAELRSCSGWSRPWRPAAWTGPRPASEPGKKPRADARG